MAVGGLHVKDGNLSIDAGLMRNLEEFAFAVGLNIECDGARRAGAANHAVGKLEPSADPGKLRVEEVSVHEGRTRSDHMGFGSMLGGTEEYLPTASCPTMALLPVGRSLPA